ncbi:MAG: nickel-dependent hydrogenase large subunit [Phycisphaerae bacterium]|nr:nickel-dependent hydrogenase large subunit [Phycisphaerae bacterium]
MTHTATTTLNIPLNRVEGDLQIRVEVRDGHVTDAWSSGTMYRGIENVLRGRGALDGLVITPRVCGICNTAHLMAAAKALDALGQVTPPPDAIRVRNLTLMSEHIQSDVRQAILMFMADFANPAYRELPLYEEAVARYAPLKGRSVIEAIRHTKHMLEIVAILGGQWPHSSYMVPGGIASAPCLEDLQQCRHLLRGYRVWYERQILGCTLDRWHAVRSLADLDAWLDECDTHRNSDLGFFIRFAQLIGLDSVGRGHANFLSFGQLDLPAETDVRGFGDDTARLVPAGFARGTQVTEFDQANVAEHIAHSWFEGYEGGKHPFHGVTRPYASGGEGQKYTWAKAPRYDGLPAETGPLAEFVIARHPLFTSMVESDGPNAFARELVRLVRPAALIKPMERWLNEVTPDGTFYTRPKRIEQGQACGLTSATRGALGHWVRIADGKIEQYQIITPTAWNGSPRDSDDVRGPWEEALVGTPVKDPDNPVEVGHVVRSFDPCLVCTVHSIRGPNRHTARIL